MQRPREIGDRQRRRRMGFSGLLFLLWGTVGLSQAQETSTERFPVPDVLRPNIAFWTRIFTALDSSQGVLHDADNLNIIYHTFSSLPPQSPQSRNRIQRRRRRYERILSALARNRGRPRNPEEKRVVALFPKRSTAAVFRAAAENIRFQRGLRDRFVRGLERSSAYMPEIERIFAAADLPVALTLLPHIESSFNNRAYSKAGAAGVWQFMRTTGRRFLMINAAVDERYDVYRASWAAAQLLRQNYQALGTWPLAITAYNHGVRGLRRAVAELGTTDFGTIVQRYRSRVFGFASKNFYAEFLTVMAILKNPAATFPDLRLKTPRKYHALRLDVYVTLPTLEKYLQLDRRDLVRWNPALRPAAVRGKLRIPKGVTIYVPQDRLSQSALQTRWAAVPSRLKFSRQPPPATYRVRSGDTLWAIAKRMGTTVKTLARINRLKRPYVLRVGRVLRLPYAASTGRAKRVAQPVVPHYRVRAGDTLSTIAERMGTTVRALAKANGLKRPYRIRAGQRLRLPRSAATAQRYKVRKGETLWEIARRNGTTVAVLAKLNDLKPPYRIRPGQILRLPSRPTRTVRR